jgi:FAD/FMN-containing dehydrogenase
MKRAIPRRRVLKQIAAAAAVLVAPDRHHAALAQVRGGPLDDLARDMAARTSGQLVRPGDAVHRSIQNYNARFDCRNQTTYVQPINAGGVKLFVDWALRNGQTFAIRGGGHSFEGKSSHPDVVLDMTRMKRISAVASGHIGVDAGVLLGDLYKILGRSAHVFPGGTCPSVGIVGHVLGGGIGDFLPMLGYAAHRLKDVTLVTFGGSVLEINERSINVTAGPPLPRNAPPASSFMKVLRGGGQGSLGVVTRMNLSVHDARRDTLAHFKLEDAGNLTADRTTAILRGWHAWKQQLPPNLQSVVSSKLNFGRSGDRYSIEIFGLLMLPAGSGVTVADVRRSLDPLFRMPEFSKKQMSSPLSVPAAVRTFLDDDETSHNRKRQWLYGSSSVLTAAWPDEALRYFVDQVPPSVYVSFYTAGGAASQGPPSSLHAAEFIVEWVAWTRTADSDIYKKIRAANFAVMKKAGAAPHAFPNYCDPSPRDYFPNDDEIEVLRAVCDPLRLSTSSLRDPVEGSWPRC